MPLRDHLGPPLDDLRHWEGFCDHPQTDVVGDPAAFRKGRNSSRHLALSLIRKGQLGQIMVSQSLK